MNAVVRCMTVLCLPAALVLIGAEPSISAQAPDQVKPDERLTRLEKRLEEMEKILGEMRATLKDRRLSPTTTDDGTVKVPPKVDDKDGTIEVYYRLPFKSPPKLTIVKGSTYWCTIVEQKPDHFKLANRLAADCEIKWRAEGMPASEQAK